MWAQSPVTISIDSKNAGAEISPLFSGLSFETQMALPNADGGYYFRPSNKPLVALFRTLGIKNLRVGGNTADRATVNIPNNGDLDSLFAFAEAAGVKVIYTLRLNGGDPKQDGQIAKYIMQHYKADLVCLAIGNEPNVFAKEYPVYREEWKNYMAAITAPEAAPDAMFCGPSATPGKTVWARDFIQDFGHSGKVMMITQHAYPGGAGGKITNAVIGQDLILSPEFLNGYEKFYRAFAPMAISNGLPYRLEEANSFFNGGAKGVSDTYASALWSLEYMYWWAAHEADGINFHTGDKVSVGKGTGNAGYATYTTSAGGYAVHPIGYGIKMFDFGGRGRLLPVNVITNAGPINLSAYATLAADGSVYLTLLNKEHGTTAASANVTIENSSGFGSAEVIYLRSLQDDVGATSGVTLGGAAIKDDGGWAGSWERLERSGGGEFVVKMPVASAAVVRLVVR